MIASVVMLMVLLSGLVAASSVNVALRAQYTDNLAKQAAEAGAAMAEACLKKNNYVASWSANPLRPGTLCDGTYPFGISCPAPTATLAPTCGVIESANLRTSFSVSAPTGAGTEKTYLVTSYVYNLRGSSRALASTLTYDQRQSIVFKDNPALSRPVKRFWLFGDRAGLDFQISGTTATPISKCSDVQASVIGEGVTVISKRDGTLQFWTDGRTIWDKNCNVMNDSNNQPSNLNANPSTTQAASVFPLGTGETRYVIVTNTTENSVNNAGELYFSIVDMTLNGGQGAVQAAGKNTPVWPGNTDYSSEAQAAAPKTDGSGFWVLTYTPFTLAMRVFSFDNAGVPSGPIAQPANTLTPTNFTGLGGFGTLNFDTNYSRLVMMAGDHCFSGSCTTREGIVRLMTFNSSTGQVAYLNNWRGYADGAGYSADFSPSGTYIYTSAIYPGRLARYTVTPGSTDATIKASETYLGSTQPAIATSCTGGGQILRAPDNKMYIANCGTNYLSVLNTPDLSSPGFVYNGISLGAGLSYYGLPQSVTIYSPFFMKY